MSTNVRPIKADSAENKTSNKPMKKKPTKELCGADSGAGTSLPLKCLLPKGHKGEHRANLAHWAHDSKPPQCESVTTIYSTLVRCELEHGHDGEHSGTGPSRYGFTDHFTFGNQYKWKTGNEEPLQSWSYDGVICPFCNTPTYVRSEMPLWELPDGTMLCACDNRRCRNYGVLYRRPIRPVTLIPYPATVQEIESVINFSKTVKKRENESQERLKKLKGTLCP